MIQSWDEYNELETLCDDANDRLISGEGQTGVHFSLMFILRKHGINAMGREGSVKETRKLLDQFVAEQINVNARPGR